MMLLAAFLIVGYLFLIDYSNPAWKINKGSYVGIVAMLFAILAMFLSNRHEKRKDRSES